MGRDSLRRMALVRAAYASARDGSRVRAWRALTWDPRGWCCWMVGRPERGWVVRWRPSWSAIVPRLRRASRTCARLTRQPTPRLSAGSVPRPMPPSSRRNHHGCPIPTDRVGADVAALAHAGSRHDQDAAAVAPSRCRGCHRTRPGRLCYASGSGPWSGGAALCQPNTVLRDDFEKRSHRTCRICDARRNGLVPLFPMLRLKPSPSENVTQGLCYSPGCGQHVGGHDAGCSVACRDFGADIGVTAGVPCHSRCSTAPTSPAPFPIRRATSRRRLLTEKVRHGFRPAICGVIWRRPPTGTEPSSAGGSPALTPPRGAFGRRCTNGRCLGQAASGEGSLAAMPCRSTPRRGW